MTNKKNCPSKFLQIQQESKMKQVSINESIIKLYISMCQEPIPDIVNSKQQSIFSHFKFYFSDPDLSISSVDEIGDKVSVLHQPQFQEHINMLFQEWKRERIKKTNHNQKKGVETINHMNFIAFVEYWIQKNPQLIINYRTYNQLVSQSVQTFLENKFYSLSFSLIDDQRPFKLKKSPKKSKKSKKNTEMNNLSHQIIQKRLNIYFTHFSKIQNIASSPTYVSKTKTFDQIVKSYSAVNLQQWIVFIKSFSFDKAFEEAHRIRASNLEKEKKQKINDKGYLPVKNVKWNSSLQYFKNLFEKFCDNSKHLEFQSFKKILKKLFSQIFSDQQEDNSKRQEVNSKDLVQNSEEKGVKHLELINQEQFNKRLRSFGLFVPLCPIVIQSPDSKNKRSYHLIKPKYLEIPKLPLLSENKIRQGKKKIQLDKSNNSLLPGLFTKSNEAKIYTLSSLLARKRLESIDEKQQIFSNKLQKKISKQNKQNIPKPLKIIQKEKSQQFKQIEINNGNKNSNAKKGLVIIGKLEKNPSFLSQLQKQLEAEPDEYLRKYQNKESSPIKKKGGKRAMSEKARNIDERSNIIKKIDERVQKMHKRAL